PYILTMTSGSTGDPKPIGLTQATKFERAMSAIGLYQVSADDRILAATPLYHSLAERLALMAMISGATLVLKSRFSATQWMNTVREQRVSFTIAVSSQLKQVAGHLACHQDDFSHTLRCVVSSSALLEPPVKAALIKRLDCDFHECYGASEIAIATNLSPGDAERKVSSVGRPIPGVEVMIVGDRDQPMEPGQVGEIVCRTPLSFSGYYQKHEKTVAAWWHEYFRTGDLGKLDEEGFLYYIGRKKELIISGGINIYPSDIEAVIGDVAGVDEVAAFAMDDSALGEVVAVAVVPMAGSKPALKALRLHCARNLSDYQIPRKILLVESLPRNSMGKVVRRDLKQLLVDEPGELRCA
ncbi:MAG TPA: long-chain fatty acid--CoA ligase, partial [Gammaproteobacteria bacterium]|nr:long-chain fatty acid--CoA ligase [Gammaproteobacteria bacterium]